MCEMYEVLLVSITYLGYQRILANTQKNKDLYQVPFFLLYILTTKFCTADTIHIFKIIYAFLEVTTIDDWYNELYHKCYI